jgi:hypothetical protein
MSIRNKRLQKELLVIDNLILEDNWEFKNKLEKL